MDYAYTESTDPTCGDEWTSEDVAGAFQAGALLAGRADRERSEKLAAAIVVAMQCIKAAYEDNWTAFDALSDDFDDAVSAAMQMPPAVGAPLEPTVGTAAKDANHDRTNKASRRRTEAARLAD